MQISTQNLNKYIISEEVGSTSVTKSSVLSSALSTWFLKKNNRLQGVYCVRVRYAYQNHTWIIQMYLCHYASQQTRPLTAARYHRLSHTPKLLYDSSMKIFNGLVAVWTSAQRVKAQIKAKACNLQPSTSRQYVVSCKL